VAAVFTGAEQPARLGLDDHALLTEWKSAYTMQAPVALLGSVLGLLAWWHIANKFWLYGAVVLVTNGPYTLFFVRPTNDQSWLLTLPVLDRRAAR